MISFIVPNRGYVSEESKRERKGEKGNRQLSPLVISGGKYANMKRRGLIDQKKTDISFISRGCKEGK